MESLNAPGYHMHFLTEDRLHGGHLIECVLKTAHIGIQHVPKLDVGLPVTLDFLTADLTRDIGDDLDKAEKQKRVLSMNRKGPVPGSPDWEYYEYERIPYHVGD
jgi:hypothetical protein